MLTIRMPIESLRGATYAFVDVETTGSTATYGQIIEIAIIRVEDGSITDAYQTLLRPDRGLSPFITDITGITDAILTDAPSFADVAPRIKEMLDGAVFVAHNARFDYAFVKSEFRRLGISWNARTLCTVKLSRRLYAHERHHNLDALIERHGLPMENRHRAHDDAMAMIDFIRAAEAELTPVPLSSAIASALGSHTLPPGLDERMVADLPHAPGVYFFYGEDDTLLYVGKSIDIKARVRSHFSGDHATAKERILTSQTVRIEHEETSGELSALLRENALIKERMPLYNRKLRKASKLAVIESGVNGSGYQTAVSGYHDDLDETELGSVLGVFRTNSQAKAALRSAQDASMLCAKLLGLETGPGPCFAYQLGRCRGACVGKEAPAAYNARFSEAFASRRLRAWPFDGAVLMPEDPGAEEGLAYVIDQWRIQKAVRYSSEGFIETDAGDDAPFDYDSYRILAAHLLRPEVRRTLAPYRADDGYAS